jgi:hypothetical protein
MLKIKPHLFEWRFPMVNLSITLFFVAILFYLQEVISEKPRYLRASIFLAGVIVATLSLPD